MGLLGRSTSLILFSIRKIIDYLISNILRIKKRSGQSLITARVKRLDTLGEMERIERGRDNMTEFSKMVPDECLIDLSHRWYSNG